MPYFLESTGFHNPADSRNGPFQYGHKTSLGFFEFLVEDPRRAELFNSGMQSAATVGNGIASVGPYPFEESLEREKTQEQDIPIGVRLKWQ